MRNNRRRGEADVGRKKPKRPLYEDDDDFEYEERKRKPLNNSRETRKPSRVGARRPPSESYEDDLQEADEDKLEKRRKSNNRGNSQTPSVPSDGSRAVIKPVSGTLYDRPRLAPRINLPVPKNAAHKYAYKPIGGQSPPTSAIKEEAQENLAPNIETTSTPPKPLDIIDENRSKKTKLDSNVAETPRMNIRKRPVTTTEAQHEEPSSNEDELASAPQEEPVGAKPRTVTRKFRRPFLPSRGGNPYASRNLKPVGDKAINSELAEVEKENPATADEVEEDEIQERRPDKTKSYRVKSPLLIEVSEDLKKPTNSREAVDVNVSSKQRIESQDKPTESSIEKFYENYDETLNEASPVNPLPFRKYPTGTGSSNSYLLNNRFYRSPLLSLSQSK